MRGAALDLHRSIVRRFFSNPTLKMSVYRAASNYFTDMLDYLNEKTNKFTSLNNYMDQMNDTMKKEFMIKLSDTVFRMNMLFISRQAYWNSKKKEQTAILAIFSIISATIGIIFYIILYFRAKKEPAFFQKDGGRNWEKIGRTFLNYTTIYMVIMTVFVAMLKNAGKMKKFYKKETEKAAMEGKFYSAFMFQGANKKLEDDLFKMAYLYRGNLNKEVESAGDDFETSNMIRTFCKAEKKTDSAKPREQSIYNCATNVVNFETAYDSMKSELKLAMKRFMDGPPDRPNIDGYTEVRQLYIVSSPVPMLKETKRIVDSYYNMTLKEKHGKENKPPDAEKQKAVIKSLVIEPISFVINQSDEPEPGAYESAQKANGFKAEQEELQKIFLNMAAYVYQVYYQKKAHELPEGVRNNLPWNRQDFDVVRIAFDAHKKQKLGSYMNIDTNDAQKISSSISEIMLGLIGAFEPRFTSMLVLLSRNKINGSFVFAKDSAINSFMNTLDTVPEFNESYRSAMKELMYSNIVVALKARVNMATAGLGIIVEGVSNQLVSQNIDIAKYNDYMFSELTKDMKSDDLTSKSIVVSDTLSQIAKTVAMKRQLKQKPPNEERFLDDPDFVEAVNGMTFNDLKNTLEAENLTYIVNQFYNKVSEAINRKDESMDNIYFNTTKQQDTWTTVIWMTTVTIVLVWVNYFIGLISLNKFLYVDLQDKITKDQNEVEALRKAVQSGDVQGATSKEQEALVLDKLNNKLKASQYQLELVYREKRNRTVNWYIRLVVPACFMVFVIAMMFGVLKKAVSKHEFNVDMIESNTSMLRSEVDQLRGKVSSLLSAVPTKDGFKKIKDINEITDENKIAVYRDMRSIIEKFERCNFILESQKKQLPFPYSEVAMGGFMIFITMLCILYVFSKLKPVSCLKNIRELNKLKAEAAIANMSQAKAINRELQQMIACHEDDIDAVVFTLKVVFFIFIVTFLIFYSTKVVTSSSDYKNGLYNSGYFETSNCVA